MAEPGVDAWYGTFPSEASAAAWAAVDQVARRYVTDGVCSTIDQARGKALTDLVLEHSDVRVQLVLTTPADAPAEKAPLDEPAAGPATEPIRTACRSRPAATGAPDDLVQVHGVRPSEPVLVRRGWLEQLIADRGAEVTEARCHPSTGARVDDGGVLARDGYRPGGPLTALVKARDGHCRFPGCPVAARFCDLDHVRPWPTGPTAATNLLTLCRRHHRIKQAPGWRVRLRDDGVAEWTDPTGTTTRTYPVDALDRLVLPAGPGEAGRAATARAATASSDIPAGTLPRLPSALEEALDHRLDQHDAELRHLRRCRRRASHVAAALARHRRRHLEHSSGDPPF